MKLLLFIAGIVLLAAHHPILGVICVIVALLG
jgi:hypothetical protein